MVLIYSVAIFFDLGVEGNDCDDTTFTWEEQYSNEYMKWIDLVFLSLFMLELTVKSFAYGHKYFKSSVTMFDTTIVVVSFVFTVISVTSDNQSSTIVRVLRLGRIIRVLLILNKLNKSREGLKKMKYKKLEGGVEAPVYKVIALLQDMAVRSESAADKRHLDWIIDVIGSDRLYTAVFNASAVGGGNLDSETTEWLNSQYAIKEKQATRGSVLDPTKKRNSIAPSSTPEDIRTAHYGLVNITPAQERQLDQIMENVHKWDFSCFELFEASEGMPLAPLVLAIFKRHNLFDHFRVQPHHLAKAMTRVQAGYCYVPYHNRIHAADVTQTLYSLLMCDTVGSHVNEIDLFSAILAAAVHDYGHPGFNNPYHVKNRLEVAITYNDVSVLENMHIARAWRILTDPEHNILGNLKSDDFNTVRSNMITMILGTDMSGHFDELARFMTKTTSNGFDEQSPENTKMILKMALHVCDVSNPAKSPDLCIPWAARVMEEFFMQGDKEKEVGNSVSPFMDRETTVVEKCQGGFIKIIVTPLYEAWHAFAKSDQSNVAVENCKMNQEAWMNGPEGRIETWLKDKGLTKESPIITKHGADAMAQTDFQPVRPEEEKYYHETTVVQRKLTSEVASDDAKQESVAHS